MLNQTFANLPNPSARVLTEFEQQFARSYPLFGAILQKDYETFGQQWADALAENIVAMFGDPGDQRWTEGIRGYAMFSLDALKSQKFFETHGRYTASSYAMVKRECWDSDEFMLRNYLPGMFLSYYLWPHHYRLLQFYEREVLPAVSGVRTFSEVGCGTCVYSRETLRHFDEATGTGFDISPHALSFGQRVLQAFGVSERYRFEQRDVIADMPPPAEYLICQEVLEHLEDPKELLRALRRMVAPGGRAYITAAVTAGHSDHIYLYRNPQEVKRMLEQTGFTVLIERTEAAESANDRSTVPRVCCYLCS